MSTPENDLTERVAQLERYTNTLHMILEHFVNRLRNVESVIGHDDESAQQSLEWRSQVEASLTKLILEQDWHWQQSIDPVEKVVGDTNYKRILTLSEMLPTDVLLKIWSHVEVPTDLPLIWSEGSSTHEFVTDSIKTQSSKELAKTIKDIKKYDRG